MNNFKMYSLANKTINPSHLYVKCPKNDKSFLSIIEQVTNQNYKNNKISEEEYKALGGTKIINKNNCVEFYSDEKYVYPKDTICNSCKSKKDQKLTPNSPGIKCYYSETSKSSPLNIKTTCALCGKKKNSFVNKDTLPKNILSHIKSEKAKN